MTHFGPAIGFAAITVLVFEGSRLLARRFGHPILNPTFITILAIIGVLAVGRVPYSEYMRGGALIAWLLGPATVALGAPLARNLGTIARNGLPIIVSLCVGAATAAISGPLVLAAFGGSGALERAMAPKAATTPIAMAVAHEIGGTPSLAAIFAIAGGVTVAVAARPVMTWLGVEDSRAFGLAAGVAGSGIGAAEAVTQGPEAAAYAALGVGLTAITTALFVPILAGLGLL